MILLRFFLTAGAIALLVCGLLLGLASTKGWAGERLVRLALRLFAPRGSIILNDLYFHNGRRSCQIDHLVVAPTGIFVIETKTYLGEVSGDAMAPMIRRRVLGRTYMTRNPVDQNNYHIRYLLENFPTVRRHASALRPLVVYAFMTRLRLTNNPGSIGQLRDLPAMLLRHGTAHLTSDERSRLATDLRAASRR